MSPTLRFERSHEIRIDAPPEAVFDYVANPNSWPEWIAASHRIDCPDRWLRQGERFHEQWHTSKGAVALDWEVLAADRPRLWTVRANTGFIGPIVTSYSFAAVEGGTLYRRSVCNPERPKAPTPEMIARIDAEATTALANIKRQVERRLREGRAGEGRAGEGVAGPGPGIGTGFRGAQG